ncbi:hypothetical protein DFQ29_003462, partial [Apophysomyces sp. BC1021]
MIYSKLPTLFDLDRLKQLGTRWEPQGAVACTSFLLWKVSANELDLVKLALVDFGDANFARAHITAFGAQVLHALQSQFKQIAMLNTRGGQRHKNITLHTIHACPECNVSWRVWT